MLTLRWFSRMAGMVCPMAGAFVIVTACSPKRGFRSSADLAEFATRYAAAWSSQNPVKFAAFYDENGSLIVNGAPSVGRAAITATARAYMTAFPDMVVKLDSLRQEKDQTIFHWTWTGTNTGPGGTGKAVKLSGFERWTMGANGLIAMSDGHFDNDEYQRQLKQAAKVYRVGALFNRAPNQEDRDVELLKEGLARLGYVEGSNLILEARFAEGKLDRLPGFAADLVGLGVDVIAAYGGPPTRAARGASTSIPIVANLVADPVALGYAATLQRPGGNVTGITNHDPELAVLQLKILRDVFPTLERVAFLSDADIPGADSTGFVPIERSNLAAAAAMKITPHMLKLRGPAPDFDAAFSAIAAQRPQALIVLEVPVPFGNRMRIAEIASARRIPTMFWGGASTAGGMMSYGTTFSDGYPLMPVVIDKVLKGANPAVTPFEVITRRQFVVNLKMARELGVTIPDAVLKRADRVIR